jgi:hypothetical protein
LMTSSIGMMMLQILPFYLAWQWVTLKLVPWFFFKKVWDHWATLPYTLSNVKDICKIAIEIHHNLCIWKNNLNHKDHLCRHAKFLQGFE